MLCLIANFRQVQLQNLMTSKYIDHFLEAVSSWQQRLSLADQVISTWSVIYNAENQLLDHFKDYLNLYFKMESG